MCTILLCAGKTESRGTPRAHPRGTIFPDVAVIPESQGSLIHCHIVGLFAGRHGLSRELVVLVMVVVVVLVVLRSSSGSVIMAGR